MRHIIGDSFNLIHWFQLLDKNNNWDIFHNLFDLVFLPSIRTRANKIFLVKVHKSLPNKRFKTMRLTAICNVPKQTISASSGFGALQIVPELDIERCASEDARPPRRWIVRYHIGWRGERNILYKGVKTSPQYTCFKTMRMKAIRNGSKWTISTSNGLGPLQDTRVLKGGGLWDPTSIEQVNETFHGKLSLVDAFYNHETKNDT